MRRLLQRAVLAVECENSLWVAKKMPDYDARLAPQKRLGGKPGLKKTAVAPTVIIKEEDRRPLRRWQESNSVQFHVWQVFYDIAFGLALDDAERLIAQGLILPTTQTFQAPGGATTSKVIYEFYHHYAYVLGNAENEPRLVADHIADKNGHILPFVSFEGGKLRLGEEALGVLDKSSSRRIK